MKAESKTRPNPTGSAGHKVRPRPGLDAIRAAQKHEAFKRRRKERLSHIGIPALAVVVIAAIAAVVVLAGGFGEKGQASHAGSVKIAGPARATSYEIGETIPAFSGPSLWGGDRVAWNGKPGTPTVIAVWAPWCPHCQKELPLMGAVSARYPNVRVLTVVSEMGKAPGPDPAAFLRSNGLSFATAVDDANSTLMKGLGVTGTPTVYYVGSDGRVASVTVGEISPTEMAARFQHIAA